MKKVATNNKQDERDWILEHSKRIDGVCAFHLNNDFAKYCDLFVGGYNNFIKGQQRLRAICNKLEKEGLLWSEWEGTGLGGGDEFGTKRYKSWYSIDNKWNKK